jgi:hypothetical protein
VTSYSNTTPSGRSPRTAFLRFCGIDTGEDFDVVDVAGLLGGHVDEDGHLSFFARSRIDAGDRFIRSAIVTELGPLRSKLAKAFVIRRCPRLSVAPTHPFALDFEASRLGHRFVFDNLDRHSSKLAALSRG